MLSKKITIGEVSNKLNHESNCEADIKSHDDMYKNGKKRKQRSTTITGDSILKDIGPRKMREAMGLSEKVYIKSFSACR